MENPTTEQLELLSNYPTIAIEYAIARLKKRHEHRGFNYFLGIVKNFVAQKQPKARTTTSKQDKPVEQENQSSANKYKETATQKERYDYILRRSQARIKARNAGLEQGTLEYKEFVTSHINSLT